MKIDLVTGITPVSMSSIEQTTKELTELIMRCRGENDPMLGNSAREVAHIAHRSSASLVAVAEHAAADPALLFGTLVSTSSPLTDDDATELRGHLTGTGNAEVREVVTAHTSRGYLVVFAERVVTADQLRLGVPFDCQLQAAVADPVRPRIAVFTLSSTTGRGWLELSDIFGRMITSVDFSG